MDQGSETLIDFAGTHGDTLELCDISTAPRVSDSKVHEG